VLKYNPRAVFVPGNRVFDFFPGVKVQVFHGFSVNKRGENKGHFRIRGFFDLYCTQGPDTTIPFKKLEEKYKYFKVVETGWSKLDPYFKGIYSTQKNNKPTIIYTSTFTKSLTSAPSLFEEIKNLSRKNKWQWIVTFHPRMKKEIVEKYKSIQNETLQFVETDNILPYMVNSDLMVSDTSSVVSEFLVQEKPVITFRNNNPGLHLINIREANKLEASIKYGLIRPPELMNKIIAYSKLIHPMRDGNASKRVIDATEEFIENDFPNMHPKPLNLFRKLKMRSRIGYYKL